MSPSSYGYTYLTSYGWSGTGTALRKGAIAKPLAIPPKKNLSGLGKDRDEAFPFWDHVFAAASKAITIKVSSDDDEDADETEDPSSTDPGPGPFRRTATGIISNRRPVEGTPASTSGATTPSLVPDTDCPGAGATRLSLLATAKREAAKRGLYARFFRGPVLGPDNDPPETISPSSSGSPSVSTPVPEHVDGREDVVGGSKKSKKRKAENRVETQEERQERKRSKKERKSAKATKRAEKALALAKETNDWHNRKDHKHRDEDTQAEANQAQRKARKQARKSLEGSRGGDLEQEKYAQKRSEQELASTSNGQHDPSPRRSPSDVYATDACIVVPTTKKKKGKRKNTQS